METDPQSVAAKWLAPISEASPAGEDMRYEPEREALKNQISGVGAAGIDWPIYSADAQKLLTTRSKDLLVACYLGYACFQTDGVRGLASGVALVAGMLDRYWDDCFPQKERARASAIVWLLERASSELAETTVNGDAEAVAYLAREAEHLRSGVGTRFEAGAIDLEPFASAVKKLGESTGPAPDLPPPPETRVDAAPAAPQPPAADPIAQRIEEMKLVYAKPISGESPAGDDARYDDAYEAVRAEVDKLGRAAADMVDWEVIHTQSRSLLTDRTKDLRIACYYAAASFQQEGIEGLVDGLAAMSAVIESYWENGFPKANARPGAVKWLVERLEPLREVHVEEDKKEILDVLSRSVEDLSTLAKEKFPPPAPSLRKIAEAVDQMRRTLESKGKSAPTPSPQPQTPEPPDAEGDETKGPDQSGGGDDAQPRAQPTAPKLEAPPAAPTDPAQVTEFLRRTGDALHQASRQLFKASPNDPLAYRLARLGLYLHMREAPPATNGNKTVVQPPAPDRAQQLKALTGSQSWAALLEEAESLLPRARLWIDLHRMVAMALAGLGHDDARDAVISGTADVVKRMPGVLERAFSDGQPFADKATQDWLRAEVLDAGGGLAPSAAGADGSDALSEQLAEAHKLALGGKLEAALTKLSAVSESEAVVGRDRFRAKLAMAEACVAGGSHALAEGIYAGLNAEIGRYQLEEWEPNLAEACYRGRYEALMAMAAEGTKPPQELAEVYRQLCRVAPATALKLAKPKT